MSPIPMICNCKNDISLSEMVLNNTYKCAHINGLISPLILVRPFSKFSTNINDICVIKLHLFYLELNNKLKMRTQNSNLWLNQSSHFLQYFKRDQSRSNKSQNKVNITTFLSQILQRRPCPCKLGSGYVPTHRHYSKTTASH